MVTQTSKRQDKPDDKLDVSLEKKQIADRFREVIRESGGNAVVSEKSGVNLKTVSNYVRGITEPKIITASKIAQICGVSLDWLATGKGPKERTEPQAFDREHLAAAIQAVDELEEAKGFSFTPEQKTELILITYESIIAEK